MKRVSRAAAMLLSLCLIFSVCATSAFATTIGASGGDTSIGVYYTANPTFTIDIPQDFNIPSSGSGFLELECTHNSLDVLKTIYVRVDAAQTLETDGNFYLTSTTTTEKIKCALWTNGAAISDSNNLILKFFGGETGATGQIEAIIQSSSITPGDYCGRIYFTITVE